MCKLDETEILKVCFVCGNEIAADDDNYHVCHEAGCLRNGCRCNLPCHMVCCPECNARKFAKIRQALAFYASEESWENAAMAISSLAACDAGRIAREALK